MIRVTVCGAMGRVGSMLIRYITSHKEEFELVGAVERHDHPELASDIGILLGGKPIGILLENDVRNCVIATQCIVDFTSPDSATWHAEVAADFKIPFVSGTTGLSRDHLDRIEKAAEKIPIVTTPNFSIGINLLLRLASLATKVLTDEFDCEIVETHHRHKEDAPSGTALRLAEVVASTWEKSADELTIHGRHGVHLGERPISQIGMHAVRGGEVIGEHELRFLGPAEEIRLTHRAFSRDTFVRGAVRALIFVQGRQPGLYDMLDVLGLHI